MQMDMPHYHHSSTCAEIILDAYIDGGPGVQGEGMTAFIKVVYGMSRYTNNAIIRAMEQEKKENKEKIDNAVNEAPSILQDTFISLGK
jgi:hypothetical protein